MSFDYFVEEDEREYSLGVSEKGALVGAVVLAHDSNLTSFLGEPTSRLKRFHMFPAYRGNGAQKIILEKVLADFRSRGEAIVAFLGDENVLKELCLRNGFKEREGFLYWNPGKEK